MKRLLAVFLCVLVLCASFTLTAFADDTITEENLVPVGAIEVNDGEVLLNGNTYYIVWMPYLDYTESKVFSIQAVHQDGMTSSYYHVSVHYFNDSEFAKVTKWYGRSIDNDCLVGYYYDLDDPWDESYFDFPDIDATEIQKDTYYTISFTVPDDGKTYTLDEPNDSVMSRYPASVYTYSPCSHIYDNDCDANCNTCNAERDNLIHTYDNDNDNICNLCGFKRPVSILSGVKDALSIVINVVKGIANTITKTPMLLLGAVILPIFSFGTGLLLRIKQRS
jgi:hypothetical protein